MSFTTSRISQDKENKFGAIEYKVANAYVALDKDIDLVSSLERNTADLSLSTVRNKQRSIPAVTRRMPSYLSMSDEVTNISPAYLKVLGSAKSEFGLILSFVCTPAQINNIATASPSGGNPQCTASQLGDLSAASCACCMSDDTVQLVAHQNGGTSPNYTNCNDYFNDSNFVMGTVSLLAMYDGGVAIKTVGEEKFDGSGNTFTGTAFGQLTFHSPLLQSHSINDLMFGFPSALVARFLSSSIIPATHASMLASGITISMTQVASQVLTGALDNNLPVKVGNLANYTMSVGKVR